MTIDSLPPQNAEHLIHPKYRADIDGLRAIAVLSVVCFHAFPNLLKGGFIGVDIFFIISGYLISTIIFENLEHNSFSFVEFYSRRIKRIFPALLLVLVAFFVFGWFALLADEYKQLGKHIAGGAGFISNLLFWNESGYFDNTAETKPLLHLWSLGIEEQFYIVWPLLLWFAWKRKFNLFTITIVIGLISFSLNITSVHSDAVAAFYSPQTRFWELLTGSILAHVTLYKQNIFANLKPKLDGWLGSVIFTPAPDVDGSTLRNVQSFVGAALIAVGVLVITKERAFPGWWALLPTAGAVLIISAGSQAWLNRAVLSNRVLVWFGLISFPLYLWHWPLLSFASIVEGGPIRIRYRIAVLVISIVLAWLTYRLIEKPLRFGRLSKAKTAVVLLALMIVVGYVGYNTYIRDGLPFRNHLKKMRVINSQLEGWSWQYMTNSICKETYLLKYNIFCVQNKKLSPTLILLGNSYANHLYAGIIGGKLAGNTVLSFGSCDPSAISEEDCISQDKIISDNPLIKFAILSNSWPRINERGQQVNMFSGEEIVGGATRSNYIAGLDQRITFLESEGIKVVIFGPKPEINYDIRNCFSRPLKTTPRECAISPEQILLQQKYLLEIINVVLKKHPKVVYFDQNHIFCNDQICSAKKNGMPLLRDAGHYSVFGSEEVIRSFTIWAEKNIPEILLQAAKVQLIKQMPKEN